MAREKVILAYSGGLDTSVSIKWINEKYNMDVVTLTIDLGQEEDLTSIKDKAIEVGAIKAMVIDAREMFVHYFVLPALQAGAVYEGEYPLATALGRPLISKLLVDAAHDEAASAVSHGCTGKGNDQVRMDVSVATLDSDLKIIAPVREWRMTRDEELEYARKHNITVTATVESPYSTDQNLWGRSIEAGVLEDPWAEAPEDAFDWTTAPTEAPDEPLYLEIGFEGGIPVSLDGEKIDAVELIIGLNRIAGKHGVGRIDHLENRLVGIKSREIYEAPAAMVLHRAHAALEAMTLSKDAARFKMLVSKEYADLIYNGLWFSALHQDLLAFIASNQRHVSGTVRVVLFKGSCSVVGRKSPQSLYSPSLATYDKGDTYDHAAAEGFIEIHGLSQKTQARAQLLIGESKVYRELPSITPPKVDKEDIDVAERE